MIDRGPYIVWNADPCTIGRLRFLRKRRFQTMRDAERYARRAVAARLPVTIEARVPSRPG